MSLQWYDDKYMFVKLLMRFKGTNLGNSATNSKGNAWHLLASRLKLVFQLISTLLGYLLANCVKVYSRSSY